MSRPLEREERFADWVDGRMSARERQRFEAELRVNDELRHQAEEYQRTVELVRRALAEPGTEEPVDLADRVMAALPRAKGAGGRLLLGRFGPLLGSVAAAAVLIGGFLILQNWPSDLSPRDGGTLTASRNPAADESSGSRDFEVGFAGDRTGEPESTFQKGVADAPPAAAGGDALRGKMEGETGAKQEDASTELLNRRDLRLVLDELRSERALQELAREQEPELDRGLAETRQRLRTAMKEPEADRDAGQRGQAAAEPPTEAPSTAGKGEGAAKRADGLRPPEPTTRKTAGQTAVAETEAPGARARQGQAKAPAPGRLTPPREPEEKLADKTVEDRSDVDEPQLEIRQLDQEIVDPPESREAEAGGILAYGLPIERSIPVVTVQVDPNQVTGFADARRGNIGLDDFFLGNEAARPGSAYAGLPEGGWSTFFDSNALAVQARTVTDPGVFALGQTRAPDREDAGEGILVQAVPQSWVQVATVPQGERQEQQVLGRKKAATPPSPGLSYVVQGTESEVREMLANLRLWAATERRARLDIGQVAEAQVTSALDALQQQGLAFLDRAKDAWNAAEQLEAADRAGPGAAGPATPGPAGPGQRQAGQEAGRGGGRPSPTAPATEAPEPEAVVRRILLVFQEQATVSPEPEAAENKK